MTPLHRAVIEGNDDEVARLIDHQEWRETGDSLGFTPLELAQFLGRRGCQKLLGSSLSLTIKVQHKEDSEPFAIHIEAFERDFAITYRPFLTFASYGELRQVIRNCPFILRSRWIAKENVAFAERYKEQLTKGYVIPMCIRWINPVMGYGAFAEDDIPAGSFVGEYTGMVRRLFRRHPDHNAYCFHYPTRLWSWKYFVIDGLREGNVMRFVNHHDNPNLIPACALDQGVLHQIFIAKSDISKGTQLTFNYGDDYWIRRRKEQVSI